ncbi:hypothetical protein CHS0354_023034 [Potamilus streckersoni]|uniref:AB hydrolase-1 domain-containing protein n=1 Tax=Potamilus streckersoni TaxID=2493646 RepID=A0AAE0VJN2_9BIVA|nr:hypothetical protein CHS0354_023034 [Potamilus streckersoni]
MDKLQSDTVTMSDPLTLLLLIILFLLYRLLHLASLAETPKHFYKEKSAFISAILKSCPTLTKEYIPPFLWGKSGHLQTVIYAKLGRVKPKKPEGKRHYIVMPDGATMSFDVFDPHNAGEKGGTEELDAMVTKLMVLFPERKLLLVGFSMGGNIVMKYLGEKQENQKKFLCGMSICQGYDCNTAMPLYLEWYHMRRGYMYAMTANLKSLMRHHRNILFGEEAQRKFGPFDEEKIFAATSLSKIDELYSARRAGYDNLRDYYRDHSCSINMNFVRDIPIFILSAADDPLVPEPLLKYPREYIEINPKCLFVLTKHGGHLGYFEGGFIIPKEVTWLDRAIVEYADAIVKITSESDLSSSDTSERVQSEQSPSYE